MTNHRIGRTAFNAIAAFLLFGPVRIVCAEETDTRSLGAKHLAAVVEKPWATPWRNASLTEPRRVEERPDLASPVNLAPVWRVAVRVDGADRGYLMWEAEGAGRLVDFAIDAELTGDHEGEPLVLGIPPKQQFPIAGEDGEPIASGCVPTSAGSVVAFFAANGQPNWLPGPDADPARYLTLRFRGRMKVTKVEDVDGFTDGKMDLTASNARELARAMREDAAEYGVEAEIEAARFDEGTFRAELEAGRPAVVMGVARLPHKPELSWGHSIAGVGATEIAGQRFVGVLDNWYPSECPTAVRWLSVDALHSLVTVRPASTDQGEPAGQ